MSDFKLERKPIHPGEILKQEYLDEMGITQQQLSRDLNVTYAAVNEIIHGKRGISTEMAYKLGKFFNISPRFWINLQTSYEMKLFEQNSYNKLEMVKAYSVV
ncbi:MAG: HigA family addiction module antidote protein [Candidatus Sericytochromatia bacterium]|nr:HigA family addiction module antidote protein [Candidatus Sericytochromatia bacterium]